MTVWYFVLILAQPIQFGPFDTEIQCKVIRETMLQMYHIPNTVICWEVNQR